MNKLNLTPEDLEKCKHAKAILDKEFTRHFTVKELARIVGTNQNKLQAGFRLITTRALYEYVRALRIERAKELLETTYLPIRMIAKKTGVDQSNLIKQFKKMTGKTPKEWRSDIWNIKSGYTS